MATIKRGRYFFLVLMAIMLAGCTGAKEAAVFQENESIKIPILMYHHFDEEITSSVTVNAEIFKKQMEALNNQGYNTISPGELLSYFNGEGTLPPNPIMITMDDGYESNYIYAYPVLKEYNMKATIFLITSLIKNEEEKHLVKGIPKLSWEQIQEMSESGLIEFHSHTHDAHAKYDNGIKKTAYMTGPILKEDGKLETQEEYEQRIYEDLLLSKKIIEEKIDQTVNVLCYPFGAFNKTSERIAKEAGYEATVSVKKGYVTKKDGPYQLKRINVDGSYSAEKLIEVLEKELRK